MASTDVYNDKLDEHLQNYKTRLELEKNTPKDVECKFYWIPLYNHQTTTITMIHYYENGPVQTVSTKPERYRYK